jgi:hypothetical protein
MLRRLAPLLAVPVLLVTAGCSQVGEIAGAAASQAGSAAVAEVREQICAPVKDGQVSEQDQQALAGLLVAAEAAGVPAEFLSPLVDIADAGDQLPGESVDALLEACGVTATPEPSNG